jgi:hypothetical protein
MCAPFETGRCIRYAEERGRPPHDESISGIVERVAQCDDVV